jgi:hypothetical protein
MPTTKRPRRIPGQTIPCGWCRNPIEVQATGRLPKWCSANCRHRAWEQRRASVSGRAPVEVVDRTVTVEVDRPVHVVERVIIEAMPTGRGWAKHLGELSNQIEAGRVYDRDLPELAHALDAVSQAFEQRPGWQQFVRRNAREKQRLSVYHRP